MPNLNFKPGFGLIFWIWIEILNLETEVVDQMLRQIRGPETKIRRCKCIVRHVFRHFELKLGFGSKLRFLNLIRKSDCSGGPILSFYVYGFHDRT